MLFFAIRLKGPATTLPDTITFKDGTQAALIKNPATPNQAILAFPEDGRPLLFDFRRIEGESREVREWRRGFHDKASIFAGYNYDEQKGRTKPQEMAGEAFAASTFLAEGHQIISGLSATDVPLYDVFAIDFDYAPKDDTKEKKEARDKAWTSTKEMMQQSKLVDANGNERWEAPKWIQKPGVRLKDAYLSPVTSSATSSTSATTDKSSAQDGESKKGSEKEFLAFLMNAIKSPQGMAAVQQGITLLSQTSKGSTVVASAPSSSALSPTSSSPLSSSSLKASPAVSASPAASKTAVTTHRPSVSQPTAEGSQDFLATIQARAKRASLAFTSSSSASATVTSAATPTSKPNSTASSTAITPMQDMLTQKTIVLRGISDKLGPLKATVTPLKTDLETASSFYMGFFKATESKVAAEHAQTLNTILVKIGNYQETVQGYNRSSSSNVNLDEVQAIQGLIEAEIKEWSETIAVAKRHLEQANAYFARQAAGQARFSGNAKPSGK